MKVGVDRCRHAVAALGKFSGEAMRARGVVRRSPSVQWEAASFCGQVGHWAREVSFKPRVNTHHHYPQIKAVGPGLRRWATGLAPRSIMRLLHIPKIKPPQIGRAVWFREQVQVENGSWAGYEAEAGVFRERLLRHCIPQPRPSEIR